VADAVKDPREILRGEILADARRQAERLLRRARQEAEAIAKQAAQEAARNRDQMLEQAREAAARNTALQLARIPVARARMRAAHIERLLRDVREAAAEQIVPRRQRLSRDALLTLIADAVSAMEGETFLLQLSPADRPTLAESFLDDLRRRANKPGLEIHLGEPLADDASGPLLRDVEGRQIWDNRLSARLARLWPELRRQTAALTGLDAPDPQLEAQP
jgi:vacuolar-type H+-ATPase subunit E/Vma4